MGKVLTAEYDATERILRLEEPLEGVKDHETVTVTVLSKPQEPTQSDRPRLSDEAGEEMSRLVNEMFPPWND